MDKMIGRRMIPQFSTLNECYLTQNNLVLKYNYSSEKISKVCSIGARGSGLVYFIKEKIVSR